MTTEKIKSIKLNKKDFSLRIKPSLGNRHPSYTKENIKKMLYLKKLIKDGSKIYDPKGKTLSFLANDIKRWREDVVKLSIPYTTEFIRKKDGIVISTETESYPTPETFKELKKDLLVKVKEARANRKVINPHIKTFKSIKYNTIGNTFEKAGTIFDLIVKLDTSRLTENKVPKTNDKYVGIEMEFFCKANKDTLTAKLAQERLGRFCHLGTDGSIKEIPTGSYPYELRVLSKESELETILLRVCAVLKGFEANVNKSCGLHVHIDMRNRDTSIVHNNLITYQDWLYAMVPKNRHSNKFCVRVHEKDYAQRVNKGQHYDGINTDAAFREHKTFEIRVHGGTTNATKISNWVKFILKIVNLEDKHARNTTAIETLSARLTLPEELKNWIVERIDKFGSGALDGQDEGAA